MDGKKRDRHVRLPQHSKNGFDATTERREKKWGTATQRKSRKKKKRGRGMERGEDDSRCGKRQTRWLG